MRSWRFLVLSALLGACLCTCEQGDTGDGGDPSGPFYGTYDSRIAAPQSFTFDDSTPGTALLSWSAVAAFPPGVSYQTPFYALYEADSESGPYSFIGTATTNTWAIPGYGLFSTYYLKVSTLLVADDGQTYESGKSAAVCVQWSF